MEVKIAFENISRVCCASTGNADYHRALAESLSAIREALVQLEKLSQEKKNATH